MPPVRRIIVPTDFDTPSETAIAYAVNLARTLGAQLHIVHFLHSLLATAGDEAGGHNADECLSRLTAAAWSRLSRLVPEPDRDRLDLHLAVLTSLDPAASIVQYAGEMHADMVIMGTHGRGAIGRLFHGSTVGAVIRFASCPVLTVRERATDAGSVAPYAAQRAS